MKNGKRPTRRQKFMIIDAGLSPKVWLVEKALPGELHLIHRYTSIRKIISV
ncbi:DUF6906 family protein [Xylanibacillus composti]|uniref:DUF6906 family protein n=1 Tax=Xylanibacillus composti TaxID=1572762 RepID=UPI001BCCBF7E|nr:hypothetical protein [Xylanibacillus composti]